MSKAHIRTNVAFRQYLFLACIPHMFLTSSVILNLLCSCCSINKISFEGPGCNVNFYKG